MSDDFWSDVGDIAKAALVLAAAYAAQSALNNAFAKTPKTASQDYPLNQPVMPVIKFVGDYSKTAGGYVFRESTGANFMTVQAISDGRLDSFGNIYLGSNRVELNGGGDVTDVYDGVDAMGDPVFVDDGRYTDERVLIKTRLGAATETYYTEVEDVFPDLWDSACRGDDTGSIMAWLKAPSSKFQQQAFPNGAVPVSVAARGVCYDWRYDSTAGGSGSQRRATPSTWAWTANPVVWLVHKEWYEWGRDWDTEIEPVLSDLTDQADICEESVSLDGGGAEFRYRVAFNHFDDEDKVVTRQRILDAMDGFYTENGYGHLIVKAGKYETPTFTITGDDIRKYTWTNGTPRADKVDQFNISFVSPENDYKSAQCDPWIIDSGTAAQSLDLDGVYSFTQARRLAKRAAARAMPAFRGSVTVGPRGRYGLGQRYIRVQNPRRDSMSDVVCEVTGVEFDPSSLTFTFNLISADSNIDAWTPATEEGDPVGSVTASGAEALPTPTIGVGDATPFYAVVSTGGSGVGIDVVADSGTGRSDLTWFASWKDNGGSVWNDGAEQSGNSDGTADLIIPAPVPANSTVNVRVSYRTGGGSPSEWSATTDVDTSTDSIAPTSPSSGAANVATPGHAIISWQNPISSNFYGARVWRVASGGGFGSAADVSGLRTAAANSSDSYDNTVAAGSYDYYVTAENSAATQSSPLGPIAATVT